MNHVTGLFQFKMVCFHPNFSQTLQCLINQTTSQMYLFRDHLTITNNISLSNNFFLREKSAWKYTISRFSTCVDTGKNSEKHTLRIFPSMYARRNFRNGAGFYTFHADFSLKKKLFDKLILFVFVRWSLKR